MTDPLIAQLIGDVRTFGILTCEHRLIEAGVVPSDLVAHIHSWMLQMIEKHHLSISPPESSVHRNGGNNPGWGQSGVWGCKSFTLRDKNGQRNYAYSETSAVEAMLRYLLIMHYMGAKV